MSILVIYKHFLTNYNIIMEKEIVALARQIGKMLQEEECYKKMEE